MSIPHISLADRNRTSLQLYEATSPLSASHMESTMFQDLSVTSGEISIMWTRSCLAALKCWRFCFAELARMDQITPWSPEIICKTRYTPGRAIIVMDSHRPTSKHTHMHTCTHTHMLESERRP
jgi:hypothetical protein